MFRRLLLVLAALSLNCVNCAAGERVVYKIRTVYTHTGDGKVTRDVWAGFLIRDLETNQATSVVAYSPAFPFRVYMVLPLQDHMFTTVDGPRGATLTIMAKAESPGTQQAGALLESVYASGRNSAVTVGPAGAKPIPKTMTGITREIVEREGVRTGVTGAMTLTLDLKASVAANQSGGTFDAAVEKLAEYFETRNYIRVAPETP